MSTSIWKQITLKCLSFLIPGLAPIGAALAQVKVTAAMPASAVQGTVSLDVVVSGSGFDNSAKVQYFVSGARMAFDSVSGVQAFFGGVSSNPSTTYGNTVECR